MEAKSSCPQHEATFSKKKEKQYEKDIPYRIYFA